MTRHQTQLAEICSRLNRVGSSYVLMGAAAMQLWGTTRTSGELELLIDADVDNARRVLEALHDAGLGLAGGWLARQVSSGAVTVIGGGPRVAILTAVGPVRYHQAHENVRSFAVEGIPVPTASLDDLIRSKRTGRPRDSADIALLEDIRRIRGSG